MNAIADQFPFEHTQYSMRIVEQVGASAEEPLNGSVGVPTERRTLLGYDLAMRRHAAACEAGR